MWRRRVDVSSGWWKGLQSPTGLCLYSQSTLPVATRHTLVLLTLVNAFYCFPLFPVPTDAFSAWTLSARRSEAQWPSLCGVARAASPTVHWTTKCTRGQNKSHVRAHLGTVTWMSTAAWHKIVRERVWVVWLEAAVNTSGVHAPVPPAFTFCDLFVTEMRLCVPTLILPVLPIRVRIWTRVWTRTHICRAQIEIGTLNEYWVQCKA